MKTIVQSMDDVDRRVTAAQRDRWLMRKSTFMLFASVPIAGFLVVLGSIETCACGAKYPLWRRASLPFESVAERTASRFGYDFKFPRRHL